MMLNIAMLGWAIRAKSLFPERVPQTHNHNPCEPPSSAAFAFMTPQSSDLAQLLKLERK